MQVITVREAARCLDVSTAPIYSLCAERKLTHLRVGTGRRTIRNGMEDCASLTKNRKAQPHLPTNGTILSTSSCLPAGSLHGYLTQVLALPRHKLIVAHHALRRMPDKRSGRHYSNTVPQNVRHEGM